MDIQKGDVVSFTHIDRFFGVDEFKGTGEVVAIKGKDAYVQVNEFDYSFYVTRTHLFKLTRLTKINKTIDK
jgi:hypothetical protein